MPDFEKIKQNQRFSEVTAKIFALDKDESTFLSGWIALDRTLNQLISSLLKEINYTWESNYQNMDDYLIFYIDIEDKNKLKEIKNEKSYQTVRNSKNIYLVILHKEIPFRVVENLPLVFDWFSGDL
ncbi:MAG: hypothetical protein KGD74_10970 [Candidatus Lokiarchaeota archaeon]|nr:hypothetical protein [Candidatus Lokiarchaeota archaeon]